MEESDKSREEESKPVPEGKRNSEQTKEPKKLSRKERVRQKRAERIKVTRLFPADKKGYHKMPFMTFLRVLLYPIFCTLKPFKMYGHKKVGKGAYIYFGNHYSIFDIFYPTFTTKEGIHFLSKQSVLEAPILNKWGYRIGAIGAMRDGSDVRTLMNAMRVLKNGEKVSLFPEGTRNKTDGDEFLPFHGGAALMAIKTKSPIVPFVICNRPRILHMTHIVFGEPMELSEYYDRKLSPEDYARIDDMLRDRLYELREEHRAMLREKKERRKNKRKGKQCKSS